MIRVYKSIPDSTDAYVWYGDEYLGVWSIGGNRLNDYQKVRDIDVTDKYDVLFNGPTIIGVRPKGPPPPRLFTPEEAREEQGLFRGDNSMFNDYRFQFTKYLRNGSIEAICYHNGRMWVEQHDTFAHIGKLVKVDESIAIISKKGAVR